MADHRTDQILDAIVTLLTGLTITGANIERGRVYPWSDDETRALTVDQGEALPIGEPDWTYQNVRLEVRITAHVKAEPDIDGGAFTSSFSTNFDIGSTYSRELNNISKEVYIAMLADRTLGQSFVMDTEWLGNSEPELSGESERVTASMDTVFAVTYRHSMTDPSQ